MSLQTYDAVSRRLVNASDSAAADKLIQLKKDSGSNPWPVIEACINIWAAKHPIEWESNLIRLEEIRKTRKDSKFASTKDKVTGGTLRYTLDIPQTIIYMIRCIYDSTELEMNREFFLLWGRKFPKMKIAEKL